jgi:hypothetical protein
MYGFKSFVICVKFFTLFILCLCTMITTRKNQNYPLEHSMVSQDVKTKQRKYFFTIVMTFLYHKFCIVWTACFCQLKIPSGWLRLHLSSPSSSYTYRESNTWLTCYCIRKGGGRNSKEHCHDDVNGNKRWILMLLYVLGTLFLKYFLPSLRHKLSFRIIVFSAST